MTTVVEGNFWLKESSSEMEITRKSTFRLLTFLKIIKYNQTLNLIWKLMSNKAYTQQSYIGV